MATNDRMINFDALRTAWSLLNEYQQFCSTARFRRKIEEQLRHADISLTQVPWKSMVRNLLCRTMFSEEQLNEMKTGTAECCTAEEIAASELTINALLENQQDDEENLTETWFQIDDLKKRFQRAIDAIGTNRRVHKEILHRILGYSTSFSQSQADYFGTGNEHEPVDLACILTMDEQNQLRTGDLIELSGNRLHDAFYVYRLPEKGIWAQIQQMWSQHQITDFVFHHSETNRSEEEIILVPAMDEYGYGVPYLFATRPSESLPTHALYKYIDINFPLVARHTENATIALVQEHLQERLKNPIYQDRDVGEEKSVDPHRFPQQYVACVNINDGPRDNVIWTYRVHYNSKTVARDLNDNADIFFSRRILEAEEQYRQQQQRLS